MRINDIVEEIVENISKLAINFAVILSPNKHVPVIEQYSYNKLHRLTIYNIIFTGLLISLLQNIFGFNRFGSNIVKIITLQTISSVLYLPFVFILLHGRTITFGKKVSVSLFVSTIIKIYLTLTVGILYISFLNTEVYFLFYSSLVLGILFLWMFIIYWDLVFVRQKKIVVFLLAVLVNGATGFLYTTVAEQFNYYPYLEIDPVFNEFIENDVINEVDLERLMQGTSIALELLSENIESLDDESKEDLDNIVDIIKRDKSRLVNIKENLRFNLSKYLVESALETIDILEDISYYSKKIVTIPEEYELFLYQEIETIDIVGNDLEILDTTVEDIELLLERISLAHATYDKDLINSEYEYIANVIYEKIIDPDQYNSEIIRIKRIMNDIEQRIESWKSVSKDLTLNNLIATERNRLLEELEDASDDISYAIERVNTVIDLKNRFLF